jgi:hypothetical protein
MRRVTVDWQGRQAEGEELDWDVVSGESWSRYKLSDGTTVKLKTVVNRVVRLDERKPDGEPLYVVYSSNTVVAQVEPHLMQVS